MTSPSRDPVQEARREVLDARDNARLDISMQSVIRLDAAWDRYDAALRASLVERVMGKVEALPEYWSNTEQCWKQDDVLAVLRAELSEGRTK